jgi:hypothetical protein
LYLLRNTAVIITVAITEIILESIADKFKPSGACKIYANAIKVHTTAGANAIM